MTTKKVVHKLVINKSIFGKLNEIIEVYFLEPIAFNWEAILIFSASLAIEVTKGPATGGRLCSKFLGFECKDGLFQPRNFRIEITSDIIPDRKGINRIAVENMYTTGKGIRNAKSVWATESADVVKTNKRPVNMMAK